ncbi:MAG: ATP synthase F0 subunit B [Candidatus Binatia bacterium]
MLYAFFFAAQAWASSASVEHQGPSINEIWFPLANFLIYAFILMRYAVPPVRGYLRSRRQEVVATIEEASAKKQQAEAFVKDYRARLAGLDNEVAAIQASLREDGQKLKQQLINEAATLAAKIKEDAHFLAGQEFNTARQKLRAEMADRAEAAARDLAQRHRSAADHGRLVEDFIQSIGQTR